MAISKLRQKELSQYGVTMQQSAVLTRIAVLDRKATASEISRWSIREPHSVAYVLDRLEKKNLIKRVKDLDRKNMIRIALTKEGQKVLDSVSTNRGTIYKVMSSLTQEERKRLRSTLRILRDNAISELGIPKPPIPPSNIK